MKPIKPETKSKTTKPKATRGECEPLLRHEYPWERGRFPRHWPERSWCAINSPHRPAISSAELAALVGAMGLPNTYEGASEALRMLWVAADVIAEQQSDLETFYRCRAEAEKRSAAFEKVFKFDASKEKTPIPFRRFLALISPESRRGATVRGEKLKGEKLFREYLRSVFIVESGTEIVGDVAFDKWFERLKRGELSSGEVEFFGRGFFIWRRDLARKNKERTSRNVKPGDPEETRLRSLKRRNKARRKNVKKKAK